VVRIEKCNRTGAGNTVGGSMISNSPAEICDRSGGPSGDVSRTVVEKGTKSRGSARHRQIWLLVLQNLRYEAVPSLRFARGVFGAGAAVGRIRR
jgi:hypothetical protein